jgi:hypothetical protein
MQARGVILKKNAADTRALKCLFATKSHEIPAMLEKNSIGIPIDVRVSASDNVFRRRKNFIDLQASGS